MVSISQLGSRFRVEFLSSVIAAISGAILLTALARLLDPNSYGLLYLALSVFAIAELFANLGIGSSAARYISEYKTKDSSQVPRIVKLAHGLTLLLLLIVSFTILLGHDYIATILNEPGIAPFLIVGTVFLFFSTIAKFERNLLQGYELIEEAAIIKLTKEIGKFICALSLVLLGFGALGALSGYALGMALGTSIGLLMVYNHLYQGIDIASKMEVGLRRRIIEYAVPLTATDAAQVLDKDIDTVLIGLFLNPVAVSYYVISKRIITFIETPASALGFTLAPTFGAEKSAGNISQIGKIYEKSLTQSLLLYIPAAAGIVLVAEPLIEIVFGAEYLGAVPVLQILSFYAILLSINLVAAKALNFLGRARTRAIIKLITSILNVILNIILIPIIGVVGAALATIITYSIYAAGNVYMINQELDLNVQQLFRDIFMILIVTLLMGIVVYSLVDFATGFLSLILVVGIGVGIWALVSVTMGLLDIKQITESLL